MSGNLDLKKIQHKIQHLEHNDNVTMKRHLRCPTVSRKWVRFTYYPHGLPVQFKRINID